MASVKEKDMKPIIVETREMVGRAIGGVVGGLWPCESVSLREGRIFCFSLANSPLKFSDFSF